MRWAHITGSLFVNEQKTAIFNRVHARYILPSNFLLPFQAHCEHGFSAWPIIYTLSLGQGHEGNRVHRLQATVSPVFLCLMRGFL